MIINLDLTKSSFEKKWRYMNSDGYISLKKFAERVGVSEGVVRGWVNRGYVPTIKIGKYVLIDAGNLKNKDWGKK